MAAQILFEVCVACRQCRGQQQWQQHPHKSRWVDEIATNMAMLTMLAIGCHGLANALSPLCGSATWNKAVCRCCVYWAFECGIHAIFNQAQQVVSRIGKSHQGCAGIKACIWSQHLPSTFLLAQRFSAHCRLNQETCRVLAACSVSSPRMLQLVPDNHHNNCNKTLPKVLLTLCGAGLGQGTGRCHRLR